MFRNKCSQCKFDYAIETEYSYDYNQEKEEFTFLFSKCLNCKHGYRTFSIPWFRTKSQFKNKD